VRGRERERKIERERVTVTTVVDEDLTNTKQSIVKIKNSTSEPVTIIQLKIHRIIS